MENRRNWAGNYTYNAKEMHIPETVEEVQELVARSKQMKVLGTRHSFNGIADTPGSHLSLQKLNRVISLDRIQNTVTVEAGIRYGELGSYLNSQGYALPNLASLPHITVAGAVATATHGSGNRNASLAASVQSLEMVQADGEAAVFSHGGEDSKFAGTVVHLGGLGVVTKLTLNVVPTFEITQYVYDDLRLEVLERHFDELFSSAYSVSLFTDWKRPVFNQVWVKRKVDAGRTEIPLDEVFGAQKADTKRHPVPGSSAENCSEQLGIPGPWHERLPHFRMDFTPSAGEELQSEYFVPRHAAYDALLALNEIRDRIAPLLYISEVRTIAADELWMSPCYRQDSTAFHFTWKPDWKAVQQVLPLIERQLAPFQARPHWGKLFTMDPDYVQSLYTRYADFRQLLLNRDPDGKFRNSFLTSYFL
ncbi:FAD-binding protein [Paenibacillus gansuensis]|uniref:FAD-binding protein n=1 Tax=Paenibacillus gansuensis TaxID=306542 RepID=A0ABW5P6Y0_9BACL